MTTATAVVTRNADLALAGPIGSLDAYLDRVQPHRRALPRGRA